MSVLVLCVCVCMNWKTKGLCRMSKQGVYPAARCQFVFFSTFFKTGSNFVVTQMVLNSDKENGRSIYILGKHC